MLKDLPVSDELNALIADAAAMDLEQQVAEMQSRLLQYTKDNSDDPLGYYMLGKLYYETGDYTRALDYLGTALALEPEFAEAHALSAAALSYMASLYDDNGRVLSLARKATDTAATLAPDRADFHSLAASVYIASGDLDTAAMALHNALRLLPAAAGDHYRLCILLIEQKQFRRARYEFAIAYVLSTPENPLAAMTREDMMELIQTQMGQADNALESIDKSIGDAKNKALTGDPDAAIALLEQALATAPDDPDILYEIGRIQQDSRKDYDAALDAFSRAAAADPLHYDAHHALCLLEPYAQSNHGENEIPEDEARKIVNDCFNTIAKMKIIDGLRYNIWTDPDNVDTLMAIVSGMLQYEQYEDTLPYIAAIQLHEPENAAAAAAMTCAQTRECGEWENRKNEKH